MTRQTKKFSDKTIVTSMGTSAYIPIVDANGAITRITLANLKTSLLGDQSLYQMNDGVFILYAQDGTPRMCKPEYWSSYEKYGAIGVVVVEGGHTLVIGLDEPDVGTMYWNTQTGLCGGYYTSTRLNTLDDWAGQSNTAAIVVNSNYIGGTDCPAGWCNAYSKFSDYANYGHAAGQWWLPSVAEMWLIYANMNKINYALSVCGGTQFQRTAYWTSTESSATSAWLVNLSNGTIGGNPKVSYSYRVRPVTAFYNFTLAA